MGTPAANIFGKFWKCAGNNWKMKTQLPASVKFGKKWKLPASVKFGKKWKLPAPTSVKFGKKWKAYFKYKS